LTCYYEESSAGDSDQQTSTVTLTILPVANLGIINASVSETVTQGASAAEKFTLGGVELASSSPTLIVSANQKWKLSVKSSGFSGPYPKDANDLLLRDNASVHVEKGFNKYTELSTTDQEVASYEAGVRNENHPMQYKVLLDWEKDLPGTYTSTVTYTLTTTGA
jgi:hypothetical protein